MKIFDWSELDSATRRQLLARPALPGGEQFQSQVNALISRVRNEGDAALLDLTRWLDGVADPELEVRLENGPDIASELAAAIDEAGARIEAFHQAGKPDPVSMETAPGVTCQAIYRPIRRVGLYVPGGSAALVSTLLMLAIPARVAGCQETVLCTPPNADGTISPAIRYAAQVNGIKRVFAVGGAQAVAAMAYGTQSIPRCDKIFGPGNAWVMAAKQQVAASHAGCAIDMPAGPSEVLVIADAQADPELVALDLLAQAEHGPDSQVLLFSPSYELLQSVLSELEVWTLKLPRRAILEQSLQHARLIRVPDLETGIELANGYAPEHLILNTADAGSWLDRVSNAGSVFLGRWTPETLGDYCSGANHVLPTYGYARSFSGLSVRDFSKRITVQQATPEGLQAIGPCAVILAGAEQLDAHRQAVSRRLARLEENP